MYAKKKYSDPYSYYRHKNNSKWIMGLHIRAKIIKLLEKNIRKKNPYDRVLNVIPKAYTTK